MDTITHTYIQQGQFAQAVEVANSIPDKRSRTGSLSYVVKMCIQQGQFAQAIEVAHTIEEERSRTDNLYHIANHLISIDIYQAYIVLGTRYIDEYIQTVSKWLSELYPYDALDIIAEMVRIAGWHDPQWRKIYEILKPNAEST